MSSARRQAASLLSQYFMTAFKAAGLDWDGDNASEVDEIVEAITDIVRDEIRIALRDAANSRGGGW